MCCDHDQLLYDTQDKFIDKNKTPGMQYRLAAIITKWFAGLRHLWFTATMHGCSSVLKRCMHICLQLGMTASCPWLAVHLQPMHAVHSRLYANLDMGVMASSQCTSYCRWLLPILVYTCFISSLRLPPPADNVVMCARTCMTQTGKLRFPGDAISCLRFVIKNSCMRTRLL